MRGHILAPVNELETLLGDPEDPTRLISYRRCADLDQREQFPGSECHELNRLGLSAQYAPRIWGGRLERLDVAQETLRILARRDLTIAIGHGKTFLGSAPVWVGGHPEQARRLAREVAAGAVVSWGLTERDHGSDLSATETTASATLNGYTLDGEKWLINNARRNHFACVLARTSAEPGSRSHSIFLVDRRALARGAYTPSPAERLHGIRGADISGFRLNSAELPTEALIGAEGHGLEIVLKTLFLTRVMCAGLSLGATDNALSITLGYANRAHRYGGSVIELPQTRRLLAEALADILLTEVLSTAAARSVHTLPRELAVTSAATKYLVPTVTQEVLTRLSEIIGTRSLLVGDVFAEGWFQKLYRDHRIVGIFDGSTIINLRALISAFPSLARVPVRPASSADLIPTVRWAQALPDLDLRRVQLVSRPGSSFLQALPEALTTVQDLAGTPGVPADLMPAIGWLDATWKHLAAAMAERRPVPQPPAEDFDLAADVALCLAGAVAVQTWMANRDAPPGDGGGLWEDCLWLRAVLARVRSRITRTECATASWQDGLVDVAIADGDVSLWRRRTTPGGKHDR